MHLEEQLPNPQRWRGAELSVTIAGNWQYYRAKVRCMPGKAHHPFRL